MITAPSDFPQRLRQLRPIRSLEELGAAACQAALLVRAGEASPAQAADDLWDMASASGLLERYGTDAVQAAISYGLRVDPEIGADAVNNEQPDRKIEDELDARAAAQSSTLPHVRAIDLEGFLKMNIRPRAMMLTPWLPVQGLAMIHAPRGTGKTRMAHGIAHAIATGSGFLRWAAPQPKRVLLLDGEMPAAVLQEMLHATVQASQCSLPDPSFFKIAAADLVRDGLPDLANPGAQQFYSDVIADADLAIIDNLSTLCRSLKENDADSWTSVQSWGLGLRRAGKSALFIHHGGKGGAQRGTSRKEDTLDAVIGLRRPPDYLPEQGARFEVHFEKNRGFYGPDAEPFEAHLVGEQWAINPVKSGDDLDTLKALRKQGMSIRDIADRTGLSKSTIQRRLGLGGDEEE
jgi:AAA domain/Helix-turn-helix domain of resolvase